MRSIFIIVCLIFCVTAGALASEIIEVPLPDLKGFYCYEGIGARYASFRLDRIPTAIYRVSIRLAGSMNPGEYYCDFGLGTQGPEPWPIGFGAFIQDTVHAHPWFAGSPELNTSFDITMDFRQLYGWPVTWDFLYAGYGTIRLTGSAPGMVLLCWHTIYPDATVTEAVLIIEGDFVVGVEQNTWGSIKSLFR